MPKPKQDIIANIRGFSPEGKSTEYIIQFAKRAAKLANNRLYKTQKAGLSSQATTGGVKHIALKGITSKATAIRAINKARTLINNPLSTPGSIHRLYREAEKEYGKSGRMKIISVEVDVLDKETGLPTGKKKLVPKAVPWGTNKGTTSWVKAVQSLRDFWTWYEKLGQYYLDSNEAYNLWVESEYSSSKAIHMAEQDILARKVESAQQYLDQKSTLFGGSDWLK